MVPIIEATAPPAPRPGHKRGPSFRIGRIVHILDYIPPVTIRDMFGVTAYACGRCFRKLGDDPIGGRPGSITMNAPKGSICTFCGHSAWPYGA